MENISKQQQLVEIGYFQYGNELIEDASFLTRGVHMWVEQGATYGND